MTILTSIVGAKGRQLHDGAIKLLAKWDPETVGEAQISEWADQARDLAQIAAKAAGEAEVARKNVTALGDNLNRYAQAAHKLAESNPDAAGQAADQALSFKDQLGEAKTELAEAEAWEKESKEAAERAERLLLQGRKKIEDAKRGQARAQQEAQREASRRADRERAAGITTGLSTGEAAIDALAANTKKLKENAAADRIRTNALGKADSTNEAVQAALAEVDGTKGPQSLADKLAALK